MAGCPDQRVVLQSANVSGGKVAAAVYHRNQNMTSEPLQYDNIADAYASRVDAAPYNALYERCFTLG